METETAPDVIDWQVGDTRTHPSEHVEKTPVVKLGFVGDGDEEIQEFV